MLAFTLVCAANARAQAGTAAEGLTTAGEHFRAGVAHYRAGRYREAVRELTLAADRVPSAELFFDLGRAHEQLGEDALAVESYRRYLRDRVDAPDADALRTHIEALQARAAARGTSAEAGVRASSLAIEAHQRGTIVILDGHEVGQGPLDRIVELSPGQHRLDATRPFAIPFRAQIDLQPGSLSAAFVELPAATQPRSVEAGRPLMWTAVGLSAATWVGTAAFAVAASSARERSDAPAADRWTTATEVCLASSIGLAAVAAILHVVEGGSRQAPMTHTGVTSSIAWSHPTSTSPSRLERLTPSKQR